MLRRFIAVLAGISALAATLAVRPASAHVTYVYIPIYTYHSNGGGVPVNAIGNAEDGHEPTPEFRAFLQCDGYGRIDRDSDEVIHMSQPGLLGSHSRNPFYRYPTLPKASADGVTACTAALADPVLTPDFAMRRVNLLMWRALDLIAAGDAARARADLDEADRLFVPLATNPPLARSLGVDLKLARAWLALNIHDDASANRLLGEAVAQRPFASQLWSLPATLTAAGKLDADSAAARLAAARFSPALRLKMLEVAMVTGRFDEVLQLMPITADWYLEGRPASDVAWFEGNRAYALAAAGHPDDAAKVIEAAKNWLALHSPVMPPAVPVGTIEPKVVTDQRTAAFAAQAAAGQLNRWSQRLDLRAQLARATASDIALLAQEVRDEHEPAIVLDYYRLLRARAALVPGVTPPPLLAPPEATFWQVSDSDRARALEQALIHPETWELLPSAHYSSDDLSDFKWTRQSGTCDRGAIGQGIVRYHCHAEANSISVAGEMALFNAALDARRQGQSGLVLHRVQPIKHLINNRLNYGYEMQLDVEFVDAAHLPPALVAVPWVVIDAGEVIKKLLPEYASKH